MRLFVLLLSLSAAPALAQTDGEFGAGFGLGLGTDADYDRHVAAVASADYRRGDVVFSARASSLFNFEDSLSDVGVLAGLAYDPGIGTVWFGLGPSLVVAEDRTVCLIEPLCTPAETDVSYAPGFAVGVRAMAFSTATFSVGVYGFADVNRIQSFQGLTLIIQRSWTLGI